MLKNNRILKCAFFSAHKKWTVKLKRIIRKSCKLAREQAFREEFQEMMTQASRRREEHKNTVILSVFIMNRIFNDFIAF